MYQPVLAPLAESLPLSALAALLPLITIFFMLGVLRTKAHWAALASVAVAVVIAVGVYDMPADLALLSASEGAVFGLFPIMWIVFAAIWVYQLTVVSGRFEDLRRAFEFISDDPRIQAIIIAFCFGALLEALAGFGAPVAISGVMLIALGFGPLRAAVTALVANTAPVAFGAIAIPILTAGTLTKIPYEEIGAYTGRQTPVLALFVPLLLVYLVDGRRGMRQTWPVALVCGGAFALAQYVSANFISVELTDIIASLFALVAVVAFLRIWQPSGSAQARADLRDEGDVPAMDASGGSTGPGAGGRVTTFESRTTVVPAQTQIGGGRVVMALMPYLIIIAIFSLAKLWDPLRLFVANRDIKIEWPGLHGDVLTVAGKVSGTTIYTFPWLSSAGTMLLVSGIIVTLIYGISPVVALRELGSMAYKLRFAFLTVSSVLALAYVMNLSAQTITVGAWIAGTGAAFAFLSPILGWLGTAVTGSDTSANALFATMQQAAATRIGLDPTLMVAANTSGGVVGKMISPQNLTIAATAVGLVGKEYLLFRRVIRWSLVMILGFCVLIYLQSNILAWMLS